MKRILTILLCLLTVAAYSQTYDPTKATVSNKPYGPAQAVPTDSRQMYFDGTNFVWRPFQNTTEVLTYFNVSKYRAGNFIIVVDSGGTLLPNGTYSGGANTFYMFKDGVADGNLVKLNIFGSASCTGCLLAANNLNDVISASTSRTNLGLGTMAVQNIAAAGDLSGNWPTITVAKFNGQPPSFYQNYNNLFNTPTIPPQLAPNCVGCNITGVYPNLTWNITGSGFTTAGVDLLATNPSTVALDTQHYRKVDTLIGINDSTLNFVINGMTYTLTLRGGAHGSGPGTGTVTSFTFTNANGITGSVTNPTSNVILQLSLGAITPSTVNGLTLTANATGWSIAGGTASRTLTLLGTGTLQGNNSGDITITGENYLGLVNQVLNANPVNVSGTNITGVLKASAEPAHIGDVTNSAGNLTLTIAASAVTNAKMANMANNTVKGNVSGGSAAPSDLNTTQLTTLVNPFTTTLSGAVPAPGSVAGKVLSDNGTWVVNGTGNTNTNIGAWYRWAIPNTNQIKTAAPGWNMLIDSVTNANALTITADTSKLAVKGADSIFVKNIPASAGFPILTVSTVIRDTIYAKKIYPGANMIFDTTTNPNGITIIGPNPGSGGISLVGTINSQAPSANGLVISGISIFAQYATASFPGMLSTASQTIGGAKTWTSAPTFTTLNNQGGIYYGDNLGVMHQSPSGTSVQVLKGGNAPIFQALNYATDGTGVLPIANGGNGTSAPALTQGSNITITGSWPNYTISAPNAGSVSSVGLTATGTGLVISNSPVTTSAVMNISGTLNVSAGGSGQSSLAPFNLLAGGSTPTSPMQQVSSTGLNGQVLFSNGAGLLPAWGDLGAHYGNGTPGNLAYWGTATTLATAPIIFDSTGGAIDFGLGILPASSLGFPYQIPISNSSQIGIYSTGTSTFAGGWAPMQFFNSVDRGMTSTFQNLSASNNAFIQTNYIVNDNQPIGILFRHRNGESGPTGYYMDESLISGHSKFAFGMSTTLALGNDLFRIDSIGNIQFLHYTTTTNQYLKTDNVGNLLEGNTIVSASYSPNLANTTNISSSSLSQAVYSQNGNIVTVTVSGAFSPTSGSSTPTTLTIDLPVTTATTIQTGVGPVTIAVNAGGLGYQAAFASVNAAGTFQIYWLASSTTSCNFTTTIQYHIN